MTAAKRIIPLLDRVLIQRCKPLEKTASGLLLPKAAQDNLQEGNVLAVGPGIPAQSGKEEYRMALKVGDRVILPSFGGMSVKILEQSNKESLEELLLYKESEILAKLEA